MGAITKTWGSYDNFQKTFNTYLAGIQGSGWAWLVKNTEARDLEIIALPVCFPDPDMMGSMVLK